MTIRSTAADLQLAAAMPHTDLVEPFKPDEDGYLPIPDRPGLGVTPDPDKVARYSPKAKALFQR